MALVELLQFLPGGTTHGEISHLFGGGDSEELNERHQAAVVQELVIRDAVQANPVVHKELRRPFNSSEPPPFGRMFRNRLSINFRVTVHRSGWLKTRGFPTSDIGKTPRLHLSDAVKSLENRLPTLRAAT